MPVLGRLLLAGLADAAATQACHFVGFASTHFLAAASSFMPSLAMYSATWFWSSLVQLKALTKPTAGLPESIHAFRATLFRL